MGFKIIDCSIRDGGHINKWHLSEELVKASYFAASKAQVDYFEIGYKNDEKIAGFGPFGYCKEGFIFSLFKSLTDTKLLYMIDAGKYTGYFIPKCERKYTPFSGVRVAAYPYEGEIAIKLVEDLHKKGYEVFLQLMAWSEWTKKEVEVIKKWKKKNIIMAVSFADSFGSFIPSDITKHFRKLKSLGFKSIGFHSHNNLQMAFANALQAIKEGASVIDASIYGLGRGAGNLPVEILLSYLQSEGNTKYNVVPYLDVIERFYLKLHSELKWGYSLKTLLSGGRNIHPYYVSEIFKNNSYTVEEIWNALDYIKQNCPISFNEEKLKSALQQRFYTPTALDAAKVIKDVEQQVKIFPARDAFSLKKINFANKHKNKKFLVITNGKSIKKYKSKIEKLILKENPVTIGCNYLQGLFIPDYHIFVSKKRFLKYISDVNKKSILLIPTFFGRELVEENYNGKHEYIDIKLTDNPSLTSIDRISQQNIYLNVGVSAILTALQMGAKEIMIVGMDGYRDEKTKEIAYFYNEDGVPEDKNISSLKYGNFVKELDRLSDFLRGKGIPFYIVTPTSHKRYYKNILNLKTN